MMRFKASPSAVLTSPFYSTKLRLFERGAPRCRTTYDDGRPRSPEWTAGVASGSRRRLRAQIIVVGCRLRDEGRSWGATAAVLGLPTETVRRLCSTVEPRSHLLPVVVEADPGAKIVLVSPGGWRIEGLDAAALLALIPRLP